MINTLAKATYKILAITLAVVAISTLSAEAKRESRPKAIITINIENLRADYYDRYVDKLRPDGFIRLYSDGFVCTNNSTNLAIQTNEASTATIHTGTWPYSHGVIDKQWFNFIDHKKVNCTDDNYFITVGGNSDEGSASAVQLQAPTFGDHLKLITNKRAKVYSVAPNRSAAILSAGHIADGAFWIENSSGKMVSSSYYIEQFPQWALKFNKGFVAETYLDENWKSILPIEEYTESQEDAYILESGFFNRFNEFPYNTKRLYNKIKSYRILKALPFANRMVNRFTKDLITAEEIGKDDTTDLLNITFTIMDIEATNFGPISVEVEDTYIQLDEEIATLLNFLDDELGEDNYTLALTGQTPTPYPVEYLKEEMRFDTDYFYPEQAIALLKSYLNIKFEDGAWIEYSYGQQIYLDRELIREREIDLNRMQKECADFLLQFRGVNATYSSSELRDAEISNGHNRYFKNSFNLKRSGDVIFTLDPGWQISMKYDKYLYSSEQKSPLVFIGSGVSKGCYTNRCEVIDIIPTLAYISNISTPSSSIGNAIESAKQKVAE